MARDLLVLVAVAVLGGCSAASSRPGCPEEAPAPSGVAEIGDEDRAVFRALTGEDDVIVAMSGDVRAPSGVASTARPRFRELFPTLMERNRDKRAAISKLGNGSCLLTETQERAIADSKDYWPKFHDAFGSRRMVHLLLPAYSADGRTALVYMGWQGGGREGAGNLVLLERSSPSAAWRAVEWLNVWDS